MANYTRSKIKQKINRELPIIIAHNHLVLSGRIHPNAILNEHILNGEIPLEPFDLDDIDFEKDKAISTVCFFHNTLNSDSTNFVLPLGEEVIGPNGKPKPSNFYNCFACQHSKKPLSVIDYYMVMRFGIKPHLLSNFESDKEVSKAYYQTIQELSTLMGIVYDDDKREISDEEKKIMRRNLILKRSADIYHQALKNGNSFSKDVEAFAKRSWGYLLNDRGFRVISKVDGKIIQKNFYKLVDELKLGCAPNRYDSTFLYDQLKNDFSDEELLDAGVVKRNDKGKIIDFHKNGIILPYTYGGRVHNLYCRQFTDNKRWRHMKLAKDIEFPVNFDKAKKFPFLIMVEGEMDFVTWKALGFDNVISIGGTNGFADEHLNQILYEYEKSNGENCRTIYICLDGDSKGQEAVERVADKLLKAGIDVRIIRMKVTHPETGKPFADDPNKFFQEFGLKAKEMFEQLIKEAISYAGFKFIMKVEKEFVTDVNEENPINGSELLGFIRRNRKELNIIPQEERLFLALEIADYFKIERQWLLDAWKVSPKRKASSYTPFPEKAFERKWVMVFQDESFAKICAERLDNVVCYSTPEEFLMAAKEHKSLNTIVLHVNLPSEYKDVIFQAYPHITFQSFIGKDEEEVAKLPKYDFMALFRKSSNPYLNAAS